MGSALAAHWGLDPSIDFLNHGSYGACSRAVLDAQAALRDRMEAEPVRFLGRELEDRLADARQVLGAFVGADPDDLAFVANATTGVNTVLQSLRFDRGDELLTTDHEYNAILNAMRAVAARDGARVVVAHVPFPIGDPAEVVAAILGAVTERTRLALISHVTSPTALIFPAADLVRELSARGVDTLLDAAHSPGMVPLDLNAIGAAYTTGNAHKWLCAPKGSAFLHVRRDRRDRIRPLVISHGANDRRPDRSRFRAEFDWTGTSDPTAALSIPGALRFLGELRPGGWPELMAANRDRALAASDILCQALGIEPTAPPSMIGAMAEFPLPRDLAPDLPPDVERRLFDEYRIEVPVVSWPVAAALGPDERPQARLIRISAQAYNDRSQYERLAEALRRMSAATAQPGSGRVASAE
jgi:isopenicillin-N epimerase